MKPIPRHIRKIIAALCIIIALPAAVILCYFLGLFDYVEYKTYDLRVALMAESTRPSDEIEVILLDQHSIDWANQERGWSWPWPRRAFAELVDYMNLGGAASVAFDVIFSEPSVYGPEDDAAFAKAAEDFGRVVHAVFLSTQTGKTFAWPGEIDKPLFQPRDFGDLLPRYNLLYGEDTAKVLGAQFPVDELISSAGSIGNVTGRPDPDSIFRRASLFTLFDGRAVPGLAAASLLAAGKDREIRYDPGGRLLQWGDYHIPVDRNGGSLLRFRGDLNRYFPRFADQVLMSAQAYREDRVDEIPEEDYLSPEVFTGKYIFFGYYAPGLFDICTTPMESVYPGVGMHITLLDNMLKGDFIRESSIPVNCLVILLPILFIILMVFSGRIPLIVAGMIIIIGAIIGLGIIAYQYGYHVPIAAPLTAAMLAFFAGTVYNYATEGSQKRYIKSAFSQYLSPTVIDQLLANPDKLTLGGERREISIFFSDVQGFTSISEKLDPSQLTELLNDYLSMMTDTILESGGTIDKYEGDAIIAFWNAPVNLEAHAARALRASMACGGLLEEKRTFFEEKFRAWNIDTQGLNTRLLTRIGLNTGYAVVGNMGSSKRFDYTMLGDAVNLASRLEGLNKQFGTYLMCSDATFGRAREAASFFGRKLAQVAVVGKREPVTVWEPMEEEAFRAGEKTIRRFDQARDLFYGGEFERALPLFTSLTGEDKPSFFYAEQCRYYLAHPDEWKGYWRAVSK